MLMAGFTKAFFQERASRPDSPKKTSQNSGGAPAQPEQKRQSDKEATPSSLAATPRATLTKKEEIATHQAQVSAEERGAPVESEQKFEQKHEVYEVHEMDEVDSLIEEEVVTADTLEPPIEEDIERQETEIRIQGSVASVKDNQDESPVEQLDISEEELPPYLAEEGKERGKEEAEEAEEEGRLVLINEIPTPFATRRKKKEKIPSAGYERLTCLILPIIRESLEREKWRAGAPCSWQTEKAMKANSLQASFMAKGPMSLLMVVSTRGAFVRANARKRCFYLS